MRLLRFPEVAKKVRLGRTAIYRLIKDEVLPAPVKQGSASFWIEHEIDAYLASLTSARRANPPTPAS